MPLDSEKRPMISKGDIPQAVEHQSTVKKTNYARFFGQFFVA